MTRTAREPEAPGVLRHDLRFPVLHQKSGPRMADMREISVLTELDNFLLYSRIPKRKVVAAADLLVRALTHNHQWLWNRVIMGLSTETAGEGYRSEQAVDVMIAKQQAKGRLESLDRLRAMGPKGESDKADEAGKK
jgi:hypothetical protein